MENRSRFGLEVLEAVTKAVGQAKVGIRLSPWSTFQGEQHTLPSFLPLYYSSIIRNLTRAPLVLVSLLVWLKRRDADGRPDTAIQPFCDTNPGPVS